MLYLKERISDNEYLVVDTLNEVGLYFTKDEIKEQGLYVEGLGRSITTYKSLEDIVCRYMMRQKLMGDSINIFDLKVRSARCTYGVRPMIVLDRVCVNNPSTPLMLPKIVEGIGRKAFSNIGNIQKIIFTRNIECMTGSCLANTQVQVLEFSEGVTFIPRKAFRLSKQLCCVKFPNSLEYISDYAFYDTSLKSVSFPKSLKVIGDYAFANSRDLESIRFNSSETRVSSTAFDECVGLKSVTAPDELINKHDCLRIPISLS